MKHSAAILLSLFIPLVCQADQQIAAAQQNLKDLGFYYGDVTGEKSTETNDAVRRYQIRNGLNITGELNDETMQALKKAATSSAATTPAIAPSAHAQPSANNAEPAENGQARQPFQSAPAQPFPGAPVPVPDNAPPDEVNDGRPVPLPRNDVFANTPYQTAPPQVQHRVVMDAQQRLADIGLYKHSLDGNFGPDFEFSLRAYQARVHLRPTGRLDLETLAALELLPGSRRHFYPPRPALAPGAEPPVRGEWIRP